MCLMTGEKAREIKRELNWRKDFISLHLNPKDVTESNGIFHNPLVENEWKAYQYARKKAHEGYMIQVEAMLVLYHLLKNELAKHIDVEKFLDEHTEETPEGFKFHEELIEENKKLEALIDQARPWVQRAQDLEPHRYDPKIESWLKITLEL